MKFTDISKQISEQIYFSSTAPSYRKVTKGINICGICKYKKCNAYNKEVIAPLENVKIFNLIDERENLECPECGALIVPKTLCFYLCEYKIKGRKLDNEKLDKFEFNGKANKKDSAQYYSPDKNGETKITELIIEIIKYL
jgi:hypothetical protein